MQRIKKGDLVQVTAGADRGKQGKVLSVDPLRGRIRVEKVRIQKRHLRPGVRASARQGGIIEQEGFINLSNVMLVDDKGKTSRVRVEERDGERLRVFATTGDAVPDPTRA